MYRFEKAEPQCVSRVRVSATRNDREELGENPDILDSFGVI
jgi:hypothetical protein